MDNPPTGTNQIYGKSANVIPSCARVGEPTIVSASGLWPDTDKDIWWDDPNGQEKMISPNEDTTLVVRTDAEGKLATMFRVPTTALITVPNPSVSPPHRVYFRKYHSLGGIERSFSRLFHLSQLFRFIVGTSIHTLRP